MELPDALCLVPAVCALLEAWSKGSIFEPVRAVLEEPPHRFGLLLAELSRAALDVLKPTAAKAAELLRCSFCLSYHVPWLLLVALWAAGRYNDVALLPLHSLAATFAANRLLQLARLGESIHIRI